jgi:hypothetical protein
MGSLGECLLLLKARLRLMKKRDGETFKLRNAPACRQGGIADCGIGKERGGKRGHGDAGNGSWTCFINSHRGEKVIYRDGRNVDRFGKK